MTEVGQWTAQPFFYVNIADMDNLGSEKAYVACKCIISSFLFVNSHSYLYFVHFIQDIITSFSI